MATKILMVAEKPSIALSIATVLSGGRMSTRRGSTDVHEFDGKFRGCHAHYKVASVIGHVLREKQRRRREEKRRIWRKRREAAPEGEKRRSSGSRGRSGSAGGRRSDGDGYSK